MRILFLVPYPVGRVASQRFRFEQYLRIMEKQGIEYETKSFYSSSNIAVLYDTNPFKKLWILVSGILKRCAHIRKTINYDFIFIHRELAPIGPPLFEWIIAKVLRKKIIYDFDDAIWTTDNKNEGGIARILRWRRKVISICRWSHRVSAGNKYLAEYALKYNRNVSLIPTTIDLQFSHNKIKSHSNDHIPVLGWTGSHSTLEYLNILIPVIKSLEQSLEFRFIVIADQNPAFDLNSYEFIPWTKNTEVDDLLTIDIGVMPLPDDPWTRGKSGLKILQFMALCIPVIASPVGSNTGFIKHGDTGYLANNAKEWSKYIQLILHDPAKREILGRTGRSVVKNNYSVEANLEKFKDLFA